MLNREVFYPSQSLKAPTTSRRSTEQQTVFFKRQRTSSSGHLHSLSRLENLKGDPQMQDLTYEQVTSRRSSSSTVSFRQIKKRMSINHELIKTNMAKEADPINKSVTNMVTQTRWRKSQRLKSQDQQILVEHYKKKPELAVQQQNLNSMDTIWHYTLSNLTNLKHTVSKSNGISARNTSNSPRDTSLSVQRMIHTEECQDFVGTSGLELQRSKSNEIRGLFNKKAITGEGFYTILIKKVEYFNKFLTDFYKTVSYLQRAYDKAKMQQDHLYNFVNALIQEVDGHEKDLKGANIRILNTCLTILETKLGQLTAENEFLNEQILYIRSQIPSSSPPENLKATSIMVKKMIDLPNTSRPNLTRLTTEEAATPMFRKSSQPPLFYDEEKIPMSSRTSGQLTCSTKHKVIILKTEGDENEIRRIKTPVSSITGRSMSSKGRQFRVKISTTVTPQSNTITQSRQPRNPSSLHYDFKLPEKRSLSGEFLDRTQRTSFGDEIEASKVLDDNTAELKVRQYVDSNNFRKNDENNLEKNSLESAGELYKLYHVVLEKLEDKVRKLLKEMKLFQKEGQDQTKQSTRLVSLQIKYFFETMVNEFHTLTNDLDYKHAKFIKDVEYNLIFLQNTNKSNVLKLTSLRNILNDSVNKVSSINKFINKYTSFDLSDKGLRKRFTEVLQSLKTQLNFDKGALFFLSEQFNRATSLCPLDTKSEALSQTIPPLIKQSKNLMRALYTIDKLPRTEEEFSDKSSQGNTVYKAANQIIDYIKELLNNKDHVSAEKYEEAERILRDMDKMKIKITAVLNEMRMMSEIETFKSMLNKPLSKVDTLQKDLIRKEKDMEELLTTVRDDFVYDYNDVTEKVKEILQQVNAYIQKITNSSRNFITSDWEESYRNLKGFKDTISLLLSRIVHYSEPKYPLSIKLIPEPLGQKQGLIKCYSKVECLIKIINTKKMFAEQEILKFFEGIRSYNIQEKLDGLQAIVQEEVVKCEKIVVTLDDDSELTKKLAVETIGGLLQLKFLLKKGFELQDRASSIYKAFQETDLDDSSCILNSINISDSQSVINISGNDDGVKKRPVLTRRPGIEVTSGNKTLATRQIEKQLVSQRRKTVILPDNKNPDSEYSVRVQELIQDLQKCFEEFGNICSDPYIQEYKVCEDAFKWLQSMTREEIELLNKAKFVFEKVQKSIKVYSEKIKPFTNITKWIDILTEPEKIIETLFSVQTNFSADFKDINKHQGFECLQGGLDSQVSKCLQIQQTFVHSIDVLKEVYNLASVVNEKELQPKLGSQIRTQESKLGEYTQVITEKLTHVLSQFHQKNACSEGSIAALVEGIEGFLRKLCRLLQLIHIKYIGFSKILADGLEPFNRDFVAYTGKAGGYIREFAEEYMNLLSELEEMGGNETWIDLNLHTFYKNVLSKDLRVYLKVEELTFITEPFIKSYYNEFIAIEVDQNYEYRNIETSDPSKCDDRAEASGRIHKAIYDLYNSEEILCRREFKDLFSQRLKKFKAMKKSFLVFAMIYSMGRNLYNNLCLTLHTKNAVEIVDYATQLKLSLIQMIEQLKNVCGEAKPSEDDIQKEIMTDVRKLIKSDILVFYRECKAWIEELIQSLQNLALYLKECQTKFKNQAFFLHEDKIVMIRKLTKRKFDVLAGELPAVNESYKDIKIKMDEFVKDLKVYLKASNTEFISGLEMIEYLHVNFFQIYFFQVHNVRTSYGDKILAQIDQVIDRLQNEKYHPIATKEVLVGITNIIKKCVKNIKTLSSYTVFKDFLLKDWELVEQYCKHKKLEKWIDFLDLAINEVVEGTGLHDINGKELYDYIEEKLQFQIDGRHKQFIDVLRYAVKNNA